MPEPTTRLRRISRWCAWTLVVLAALWLLLCAVRVEWIPQKTKIFLSLLPPLQAASWLSGVFLSIGIGMLIYTYAQQQVLRILGVCVLVAGTVLTLCAGSWISPLKSRNIHAAQQNSGEGQPPVRVLAVNSYFQSTIPEELNAAVRSINPDIFVLSETSQAEIDGARAKFPEYLQSQDLSEEVEGSARGTVILYKQQDTPVDTVLSDATVHMLPIATFNAGTDQHYQAYGMHTGAPLGGAANRQWERDLNDVTEVLKQSTVPMILAGDFNATTAHPAFRDILNIGFTDCSATLRPAPTWPSKFPVIRLDHILITQEFSCGESGTVLLGGTDHRGVWADVYWK